ncbi:MAG: helicase-related protein [Clostridium sp.]|nr:helicase-related protein [Clostridium sp.]
MDLVKIEQEIINGLTDFQKATVQRVFDIYINGANRVLVADEVGLGKTLIARGSIAKLARYYKEDLYKENFKVVYICSNQNIAGQNIKKLKIHDNVKVEGLSDTRLSMQHLKFFENKYKDEKEFIELVPLTPTTSFNMTGGRGAVYERCLTYHVLSGCSKFNNYKIELESLLRDRAEKAWDSWVYNYFKEKVYNCNKISNNEYLNTMHTIINEYFEENRELYLEILDLLTEIKNNRYKVPKKSTVTRIIQKIRKVMGEISIDLMNPDFVIMDEFQKFKELLKVDDDSETAILSRKFFTNNSSDNKVKILLLSATPYKLYSTLEEINESGSDDHYKEFIQVIDFLNEDNETERQAFRSAWHEYSEELNKVSNDNFDVLLEKKNKAEDKLYNVVCRTERMSVQGADNIIDISKDRNKIIISEDDILPYVNMEKIIEEIELRERVPIEYVKSSSYIMSFMDKYKIKENLFKHFKANPEELKKLNKQGLWINKRNISKYKEIPMGNARMIKLKNDALADGCERLLWVPPSKPYYELRGAFKGKEDFTKTLVFSAWEMVPRAISSLISYEAERKTVGKLFNHLSEEEKSKRSYFDSNRYPLPRLVFRLKDDKPMTMNILSLLYPSISLSKLFNPIDVLNKGLSYEEIKNNLLNIVGKILEPYKSDDLKGKEDDRWYYVAPLLFDKGEKALDEFFNIYRERIFNDNENTEDEKEAKIELGALLKHFIELETIYNNLNSIELGKMPNDLENVLVDMILGSPAISMLRVFNDYIGESLCESVKLAKNMINMFNSQEAIAIIDIQYGHKNEGAYWKRVLKYCRDGNIQSMLDEYAHLICGSLNLGAEKTKIWVKEISTVFEETMKTRVASINVDTYDMFKARVKGEHNKHVKMRTSYAVGFYDVKISDKSIQRKESIRQGFNSPFRPFVLASTSIGQEGLDFHNYCRRIYHWNLPSNPVDLEQREGRINRYKCYAIRKNIADSYGTIKFKENIWDEMFEKASRKEKGNDDCDLIPFWCLPKAAKFKIERIVPAFPFSKDSVKYERLLKILNLYRISLGQTRQEELIEYLNQSELESDKIKGLFMNLSPFYR